MHSAGDSNVAASPVVNDVIATTTTTQPKNTPVIQCEICNITCDTRVMLETHKLGKKHSKTLKKLAEASAIEKPAGGTMSQTTSTVMHSAGDVAASHVVNDVIATTTQPKNTPVVQCEICNITCDTQVMLERHKLGKKHLKTLQKLADTYWLKNATSECGSSSSSGKNIATFQCEVCKITCNSNEHLNIHFLGKKHLKKLKQSEKIPDPSDQPESSEGKSVELHQGKPLSCNPCGIACNSYDILKKDNSAKEHQKNLEKFLKPIGPNPAPAMEPVETTPMMIGPLQVDGKMVKADGSNGKAKRARGHVDVDQPEFTEGKSVELHQGKPLSCKTIQSEVELNVASVPDVVEAKKPPPVRNCILGLASLRTWQKIVQKNFGIKNTNPHVAASQEGTTTSKGKRKMVSH